ncbi:ash family protein, partial [Escherichia coli]
QPPLTTQAHNRASGFFVRTASSHLFRVRIMVGRTGPTSVGPGSCVAGGCNPVRLTTQNCNLWMVSFQNLLHK